jgi:hypothetical protein
MKKLSLLFAILPLMVFAQNTGDYQNKDEKAKEPVLFYKNFVLQNDYTTSTDNSDKTPVRSTRSDRYTIISSSGNAYSFIMSESNSLDYNEDLELLTFTHRGNPGVIGTSVGDIVQSYSTGNGWTWSSNVVLENSTLKNNRYPSGVIFNPSGNTDPMKAYTVYVGPSHDGGTPESVWDKNYFGSARLDGQNINNEYIDNPLDGQGEVYEMLIRTGLDVTDDEKAHIVTPYGFYDVTSGWVDTITKRSAIVKNGNWNSGTNSFDWTEKQITHSFFMDSARATLWFQSSTDYKMAWAQDGSIGYVYFIARDSVNDPKAPQPIVYKSTDGGENWTLHSAYNFNNLTSLTDDIRPTRQGTKRPSFTSESDAVVDNEGNLHIFASVLSSSTDHPDSLSYIWLFPRLLFHVYTTNTGGWEAELIDTIYADAVDVDNTWFGSGDEAMGWDHRIQASRTTDGTKVFCFWTDTDPQFTSPTSPINEYPDIKGWGKDLTGTEQFPLKDFTNGSAELRGSGLFMYVSPRVRVYDNNGTDAFEVPVTTAILGTSPLDPVTHQYLHGIGWNTTSVVEYENNLFSINGIYPNPNDGNAFLNLTLSNTANVNITVRNLLGQEVQKIENAQYTTGNYIIEISNNFDSGIYLVEVRANNKVETIKMIVK